MNHLPFFSSQHLQQLLASVQGAGVEVHAVEPYAIDNSASILVTLTAQETERLIGHFGLLVDWQYADEHRRDRWVLKVKPPGSEIAAMLAGLAHACDPALGKVYAGYSQTTGFANTHLREIEVYRRLAHPIQPTLAGYRLDPAQDTYELLIEDLSEHDMLNSVMKVEQWTDRHVRRALSDLAAWHVFAKAELHQLEASAWQDTDHPTYWQQQTPLWRALLESGRTRFPEAYSEALYQALSDGLLKVDQLEAQFAALPKTLVHNDANPRNACFRADGSFCLYDWELACRHVPAYDVIELLSFILTEDRYAHIGDYVAHYRAQLVSLWPAWRDEDCWRQSLQLAWYAFGWHRLGMYSMAHAVAPYPFLPRVFRGYTAMGKYLGLLEGSHRSLQKAKQDQLRNEREPYHDAAQ